MKYLLFTLLIILFYSCEDQKSKIPVLKKTHKVTYWSDGKTKQLDCYVKGDVLDGVARKYYSSGKLKNEVVYDEGKLVKINVVLDTFGRKLEYGTFVKGNGTVISYDEENNMKSKGSYVNGLKQGIWYDYNYNSEIIGKSTFHKGYFVDNDLRFFCNMYD